MRSLSQATSPRRPLTSLLLALLALVSLGTLPSTAQQLPNSGFEEGWELKVPYSTGDFNNTVGYCPESWTISHVGSLKAPFVGWKGATVVGVQVDGYNSEKAVKIYNEKNSYRDSETVPGYLTLGTTWSTAKISGLGSVSERDGGTFGGIPFTWRPDAISLQYKRTQGSGSTSNAHIIFYSWKGTFTQTNVPQNLSYSSAPKTGTMYNRERNILGKTTALGDSPTESEDALTISKIDYEIEPTPTDWTLLTVEIPYSRNSSNELITESPTMANIIFSAGDYWDSDIVNFGDELFIDNVKLLYYSRVENVKVKGTDITFDNSLRATYDGYMPENTDAVTYNIVGQGKSAKVDVKLDTENSVITIFVANTNGKDTDGLSEHTYTIQCWKPVTDVNFPVSVPNEMLTDDIVTINAADFTFVPDDAAEAVIASLEADNATDAILTESNGVYSLKAVNPGTVTLTATSKNGVVAAKEIAIKARPLESIAFKAEKYGIVASKSRSFSVADLIFNPEKAYDKSFEFSVDNSKNDQSLISFNDDKTEVTVTPYEKGDITIIVTSKSAPEVSATATIEVGDEIIVPTMISNSNGFTVPSEIYIGEGSLTIPTTVYPKNYNVEVTKTWTSSDETVLTVDATTGEITFAEGAQPTDAVDITVTASFTNENDEEASVSKIFTFEVRQPVTALNWQDADGKAISRLDFKQHETPEAHAVITPANASDKTIDYTIEPEGIIEYDATTGTFTALNFGKATITASAANNATEENGRKPVTAALTVSIAAMPTEITVTGVENYWVGKSADLTASIKPIEATAAKLIWNSSNENVATVDENGRVAILSEGNAIITATAENGVSGSLEITAKKYTGVSRSISGWLSVTDAEGETNVIETSIEFTTTSPDEMDLTIHNLKVKGMRLGDVTLANAYYNSYEDGFDGHTTYCNVFSNPTEVSVMNGSILADVTVESSEVNFATQTAELNLDITITSWENEKASAVFSTVKPSVPSKPGNPGAGTVTKYPGTITFTVTPDVNSDESFSYDLQVMVTVTDKGETDAQNNSIVSVDFPAMKFHKEYWFGGSEDDFYYLYDYAPFTLTDVTAVYNENAGTTVYSRNRGSVTFGSEESGSTEMHDVELIGSATDEGVIRLALTIFGEGYDNDVKGSFTNSMLPAGDVYDGTLTIEMGGEDITGGGQDATVSIIPDETGSNATFILPDFTLASLGLVLGDIRVDNVEVTTDGSGYRNYYGYVNGLSLAGGIVADVDLYGTVTDTDEADMTILVNWNGIEIRVKFNGTLSESTTGIETPEAPEAGADNAEAEWFTISGVRVDGANLAPGIYIERRGGRTRKVLIK